MCVAVMILGDCVVCSRGGITGVCCAVVNMMHHFSVTFDTKNAVLIVILCCNAVIVLQQYRHLRRSVVILHGSLCYSIILIFVLQCCNHCVVKLS